MNVHDDTEVLIEKRLHGALTAAEARRLDEHLDACDACRRFLRTAARTEETMRATTERFTEAIDWDGIAERVRGLRYRYRHAFWVMARTFAVLAALFVLPGLLIPGVELTGGDIAASLVVAALLALAVSEIGPFRAWLALNELAVAGEDPGALLDVLRRDLERRIREIRRARIVYTAVAAVGSLAVAAYTWGHWRALGGESVEEGLRAVLLALALVSPFLYGPALYYWLLKRVGPLRRDREQID